MDMQRSKQTKNLKVLKNHCVDFASVIDFKK